MIINKVGDLFIYKVIENTFELIKKYHLSKVPLTLVQNKFFFTVSTENSHYIIQEDFSL